MMECPRCGFQQPEDQFCANCGVDVKSYARKPRNWLRVLSRQSNFYLIVMLLLFGGLGYMISQSQNPLAQRVRNFIETNTDLAISDSPPELNEIQNVETVKKDLAPAAPHAPPPAQESRSTSEEPPLPSPEPSEGPSLRPDQEGEPSTEKLASLENDSETAEREDSDVAANTPDRIPTRVEMSFLETNKEALLQLIGQMEILESSPQFRLALSRDTSHRQALKRASRALGQQQTQLAVTPRITIIGPPDVLSGTQPSSIRYSFNLTTQGAGQEEVRIRLTAAVTSTQTSFALPEFQSRLHPFKAGEAIIFAGWLTAKPLTESDLTRLQSSPLGILASPNFLAGETEFVILITGDE